MCKMTERSPREDDALTLTLSLWASMLMWSGIFYLVGRIGFDLWGR